MYINAICLFSGMSILEYKQSEMIWEYYKKKKSNT